MIRIDLRDKENLSVYCNGKELKASEFSECLLIENKNKTTLEFFTKESLQALEKHAQINNFTFLVEVFTQGFLRQKLNQYKFSFPRCTVRKQEDVMVTVFKEAGQHRIVVDHPEFADIQHVYAIPVKLQRKCKLFVFTPLIFLCLGLFSFYLFVTMELLRSLSLFSILIISALTIGMYFLMKQLFLLAQALKNDIDLEKEESSITDSINKTK